MEYKELRAKKKLGEEVDTTVGTRNKVQINFKTKIPSKEYSLEFLFLMSTFLSQR